jgi:hypothetical protein
MNFLHLSQNHFSCFYEKKERKEQRQNVSKQDIDTKAIKRKREKYET